MANVNRPLFSNNIPISSSRLSSSLNPSQHQVYDLGSSSLAWRNVYAQNLFVTGQISGSVTSAQTSSYLTPGTYQITASWSNNAVTASHALVAISSSWSDRSGHADTADTATSASFATSAYTSSFLTPGTYQVTASWAVTASHAINSLTASHALNALSSSYSITSSHAVNALTSSYALVAGSAGTSTNANTASVLFNQYTQRGFKTISITTSSYTNALTVSLAANQSAYVKVSVCGAGWPGVGPIGYVADFLFQKGTFDTASTQPGVIIQEINNNAGGNTISSQIFDPGVATGSADFGLQFILSGNYDIPSAVLVYDIMGSCSIA